MNTLRQAAMLAMVALESGPDVDPIFAGETITALKAALEQPEQHPVAWEHQEYRPYGAPGEIRIHAILASQYMMPDGSVSSSFQWLVDEYKKDKNTIKLIPLYAAAAQRPWVGLTEEDVKHEWEVWRASLPRYIGFAQGIEAKLKERNT